MEQKVIRIGSSIGVTIPKATAKELGIKLGSKVRLQVDADNLSVTIQPAVVKSDHLAKTKDTTARFIERYRKDLETLAKK